MRVSAFLIQYKIVILRYALMFISFWFLISFIDLSRFTQLLKMISGSTFFYAFALAFLRLWLLIERWRLLIPENQRVSRWDYLRIILASGSINLFIPGILGSDIVRSVMVAGGKEKHNNAFLSVYMDRIIGLSSILLMGLVVSTIMTDFKYRTPVIILTVTMLSTLWFLIWLSRHPSLHQTIEKWVLKGSNVSRFIFAKLNYAISILRDYNPSPSVILFAFGLSIPIHLLWFTMVWIVGHSIGAEVSLSVVSLVTIIVWIATLLPLTIAGIGMRELGFVYLLSQYGLSDVQSILMGLFQSFVLLLFAILGIPFLWYYLLQKDSTNKESL